MKITSDTYLKQEIEKLLEDYSKDEILKASLDMYEGRDK